MVVEDAAGFELRPKRPAEIARLFEEAAKGGRACYPAATFGATRQIGRRRSMVGTAAVPLAVASEWQRLDITG